MDAFDLDFEEPGEYKKLEDQLIMEPKGPIVAADDFGKESF